MPCIMAGNQKWTGAAPIFSKSDLKIIAPGLMNKTPIDVALIKIITEPRAWIKKYLRAASE